MSKLVSYRSAEKSQIPVPRRRLACLLWLVSNPPAWLCRLHTLGQQVEGAAGEDEAGLVLGDGVLGRDEDLLARGLGDAELDFTLALVLEHLVETDGGDLVTGGDLVVVGLVLKSQGHDTLLLEVGLVNTGKRLGEDNASTEVSGLQGGVLTGGTLAVVVLGDDEPLLATVLPELAELRDGVLGAVEVVSGVDLTSLSVDGRVQGVGADVGQVALVLEPGAGGRDGISRALASDLDENTEAREVGRGEWREGVEEGQTLRGRRDGNLGVGVRGLGQDA